METLKIRSTRTLRDTHSWSAEFLQRLVQLSPFLASTPQQIGKRAQTRPALKQTQFKNHLRQSTELLLFAELTQTTSRLKTQRSTSSFKSKEPTSTTLFTSKLPLNSRVFLHSSVLARSQIGQGASRFKRHLIGPQLFRTFVKVLPLLLPSE